VEEREITLALKRFLSERGWNILSVHFPGAQGGLSISTYGKTRGWVPDLLALKQEILLTVESKPRYFPKDVEKLNALYNDEKVIAKLMSKLNLGPKIICQKSIAYYSSSPKKARIPSGFVVFVADNEKNFSPFYDDKVPKPVRDLV
jgi:hypothetical protein